MELKRNSRTATPAQDDGVIVSIVSIVSAAPRTDPAWSHAERGGRRHAPPMIQFDQFLIAMVVCLVTVHLLTAT
jgi:hypothetical protein